MRAWCLLAALPLAHALAALKTQKTASYEDTWQATWRSPKFWDAFAQSTPDLDRVAPLRGPPKRLIGVLWPLGVLVTAQHLRSGGVQSIEESTFRALAADGGRLAAVVGTMMNGQTEGRLGSLRSPGLLQHHAEIHVRGRVGPVLGVVAGVVIMSV